MIQTPHNPLVVVDRVMIRLVANREMSIERLERYLERMDSMQFTLILQANCQRILDRRKSLSGLFAEVQR